MQNATSVDSPPQMAAPARDEGQRLHTLDLAAAVCARIRQYGLAFSPRNYKIWYVHQAGTNEALRKELDGVIGAGESVSAADMERLHAAYFPGDTAEKIDDVGFGIKAELDGVATIAAKSVIQTRILGTCLDTALQTFPSLTSEGIGALVTMLQAGIAETARFNRETAQQLGKCSRQIGSLRQALEAARHDSNTDALTGLANRKRLNEFLAAAIVEATARREPLSVLLIDIDRFKSFNDRYGHMVGDKVLRLVAWAIRQHIKGSDLAARYGGEEFAVILPRAAAEGARRVAEAIRTTISAKPLKKRSDGETLGQITISVGVSSTLRIDMKADQMIEIADECLYSAKRAGRNRVVVAAA